MAFRALSAGRGLWRRREAADDTLDESRGEQYHHMPQFLPDGRHFLFLVGGDPETVLIDTDDVDIPEMWSPDGRTLLFIRQAPDEYTRQSIWTMSPEGGSEPESLLGTGFYVDEPRLSPDARWLAYNSAESGRSEVYVEPYHRDGERVRVSIDGGGQPKWRGDGRELFFAGLDRRLMSVAFRDRVDRAEVDLPNPLFEIGGFEVPTTTTTRRAPTAGASWSSSRSGRAASPGSRSSPTGHRS